MRKRKWPGRARPFPHFVFARELFVARSFRPIATAPHVLRAAMSPPTAVHREAFALALAVVTVRAVLRRLLRLAAGDERRQSADVIAAAELRLRLGLLLWRLLVLRRLLLWLMLLRLLMLLRPVVIVVVVRLRPAIRLLLLLAWLLLARLKIRLTAKPLRHLLAAVLHAFFGRTVAVLFRLHRLRLIVRILLTELLLRSSDETEVVLGVLMVRLGGDVVADRCGIASELKIFLGDVMGCAADFDFGPVRLVHARQWIVMMVSAIVATTAASATTSAAPVTSPHALVLTVSHHGSPVDQLPVRRFARRISSVPFVSQSFMPTVDGCRSKAALAPIEMHQPQQLPGRDHVAAFPSLVCASLSDVTKPDARPIGRFPDLYSAILFAVRPGFSIWPAARLVVPWLQSTWISGSGLCAVRPLSGRFREAKLDFYGR